MGLPLILAGIGAASAAGGLGLNIAQIAQNKRSAFDEELERRLAYLQRLRDTGQMGLSGTQQAGMERQLLNPVRTLAQQRTTDAQRLQAAGGFGVSGAAQSQLREEQARAIGEAAMQAQEAIAQADEEARLRQEQELLDTQAALSSRKQQRRSENYAAGGRILQGTADLAGAVPGLLQAAGPGGVPWGDTTLGAKAMELASLPGIKPERAQRLMQAVGPLGSTRKAIEALREIAALGVLSGGPDIGTLQLAPPPTFSDYYGRGSALLPRPGST